MQQPAGTVPGTLAKSKTLVPAKKIAQPSSNMPPKPQQRLGVTGRTISQDASGSVKGTGGPALSKKTAAEVLTKLASIEKTAEFDWNNLWNQASGWLQKNPNVRNALIGGGIGGIGGYLTNGWRGALGGALAGAGGGYVAQPAMGWFGKMMDRYNTYAPTAANAKNRPVFGADVSPMAGGGR